MSETLDTQELVPHGLYDIDLEEFRRRVQQPSNAISTAGKRFKLPDGSSSAGPMDCIVLDYVEYNAFYPGAYNPNDLKAPACWAYGKFADDMGPDPLEVAEPISEACSRCENNQWVKDPSNPKKSTKACKNNFRLAVIQPTADENSDIYILTVSPTGRKHWSKYLTALKTAGRHHRQQVTSVDWDPTTQQTMVFSSKHPHTLNPLVIQKLLTRCTEDRLLYASPAR